MDPVIQQVEQIPSKIIVAQHSDVLRFTATANCVDIRELRSLMEKPAMCSSMLPRSAWPICLPRDLSQSTVSTKVHIRLTQTHRMNFTKGKYWMVLSSILRY